MWDLYIPDKIFFALKLFMGDKISQNHSFPSPDARERVEYLYIFIIYLHDQITIR